MPGRPRGAWRRIPKIRVFLALACFASAIAAPWWATAILGAALCLRYRAYEVVLVGLFMDLYWLPAAAGFSWGSLPVATLAAVVLVFALEPLRRQLLVADMP